MEALIKAIEDLEATDIDDTLFNDVQNSCNELLKRPLLCDSEEDKNQPPVKKARQPYKFRDRRIISSVKNLNDKEHK